MAIKIYTDDYLSMIVIEGLDTEHFLANDLLAEIESGNNISVKKVRGLDQKILHKIPYTEFRDFQDNNFSNTAQGTVDALNALFATPQTAAAGADGADGKSAFQLWMDMGNAGTEADFLASLVGPQGTPGTDGSDGSDGSQGPQGIAGPKGDTGDTGLAGAQGIQGVQGIQGDVGPQGPKGDTGDTGPQGNPGQDGQDGSDGINGIAATVAVGAVTSGIIPSVVNVGTANAAVLNFTLQPGQDGTDGVDGQDGAVGPQGPIGLTGAQGDTGPAGPEGPQGPQGVQGDVGPQGDQGIQGIQGEQGPQGDAGPAGANGTDGNDGQGVPTGGTAGQVLSKIDGTDYNTEWINAPSGGGGGGSTPYYTFQQSGRAYMLTTLRWVTSGDDQYGTSYYQWNEQAGSNTDPIVEWEHSGYMLRSGERLVDVVMQGRGNATEFTDAEIAIYARQANPITRHTTGMDADGEMTNTLLYRDNWMNPALAGGVTLSGGLTDLHQKTISLDYTATEDCMITMYFRPRPAVAVTANRYFFVTLNWKIENE